MRALGYFRAETGPDSLRDFQAAFDDYCHAYLHQAIDTFGDPPEGVDGRFTGYQRLLKYMDETGGGYLIVVPGADHLGGDLEAVARAIVQLELAGAKVSCADEDFPDPLQNAFQTLGVKGVSRTRSDRIKQSMRERALRGQGLGRPPYGYRNGADGVLEVVREEVPVVELIYRLYTGDKLGLRLIAEHLNERGILTRRGGSWNIVTIRDILRNPTYMGTYTRFGLRLTNSHEAIIPPEVFRIAQDEASARRPTGRVVRAEPFLLSGLAYCSYCGNKMMGVTRHQTWKRKDNRRGKGKYRYYQCQSKNNQSICGYHTWRAGMLESAVVSHLRYELRGGVAEGPRSAARWEAEVRNAESRLLRAIRRAARAEIGVATLARHLADLDSARIRAADDTPSEAPSTTLATWDSLDFAQRQRFLVEHVERIVVTDDGIQVTALT